MMDVPGAGVTWESGRLEMQPVFIAKRTSAVLTTSKSRREGVLGKIAMGFTVLTLVAGPLPARVHAGSDSRRTAVVEAVEKVQRGRCEHLEREEGGVAQPLAFFGRGKPGAARQRHGKRRADRSAAATS